MGQFIKTNKLSLVTKEGNKKINLTTSSDLMKNYEAAFPVSGQKKFEVVQDAAGNIIIISLGGDDNLYAIVKSCSSKTGWTQFKISPKIDNQFCMVTTFEVFQQKTKILYWHAQ